MDFLGKWLVLNSESEEYEKAVISSFGIIIMYSMSFRSNLFLEGNFSNLSLLLFLKYDQG